MSIIWTNIYSPQNVPVVALIGDEHDEPATETTPEVAADVLAKGWLNILYIALGSMILWK